jgi:hypothetical protein
MWPFFNALAQLPRQNGTELAVVSYLTIALGNSNPGFSKKL